MARGTVSVYHRMRKAKGWKEKDGGLIFQLLKSPLSRKETINIYDVAVAQFSFTRLKDYALDGH